MKMKAIYKTMALTAVVFSAASPAADLEAQKAALDAISSFANELCREPPLVGSESKYELSGAAKAELNKVLKKVVDLGIEGAAKYQGSDYEGLLQKDLAALVKDSSNCRLEVWRDLKDRLIPASQQPPKVETHGVRIKTFPTRPGQISGVTLDLYIDDEYVDEIGNVPSQRTLDVGRLTKGLHTFRFENINGYLVDMFGNYQQAPQMSGMECEGDFGVTASKTFQLVVWNDGMGNVTCDLK